MQSRFRDRYVAPSIIVCIIGALAACGGGGGGSSDDGANAGNGNNGGSDGGGSTVDPATVPGLNANGDIDDGQDTTIYSDPDDSQVIRINLTVKKADPNGACRGADDPAGPEDYSGCTLAALNGGDDPDDRGDIDGDDGFDPELSAHAEIPASGLSFESDEMEVRGATSRLAKQKSYKVEFDERDWFGMERFQLNKHPYDLSRIRNKLAFDLFRKVADFPSLRTQFVRLYVLDENEPDKGMQDFGLFTNVEYMDEHWAENHGQDKNANIFKAEQFEFLSPGDTPAVTADPDSNEFETILESKGDNEDTTVLLDMLAALNDDGNDFDAVFNRYFHPDNFRTWLALNILLSNKDSNSQNFYLYRPKAIDNFYFTPWDYDGAFDFNGQPGEGAQRPRWTHGLSNWWNMKLVQRYIRNGGVPALTEKIDALNTNVINAQTARALINSYPLDSIADIENSQPDRDGLPTGPDDSQTAAQQRAAEIKRLPGTIAAALAEYKANLERPMPVYLFADVIDGNVVLGWDPSYDIQGDALVYDVRLAGSPVMGETSSLCTQQSKEPVPLLSSDLEMQKNGIKTTALTVDHDLTPGRTYYLEVVVRDAKGYCQSAFDEYSDNSGQTWFGVFAFDYDGTGIKPAGG